MTCVASAKKAGHRGGIPNHKAVHSRIGKEVEELKLET